MRLNHPACAQPAVLPVKVTNVLQGCAALVAAKRIPWAAVHVWGFADSPVAWAGAEHGAAWGGDGESCYSVLLLPEGDYCIYKPMAAHEAAQGTAPARPVELRHEAGKAGKKG